MSATALAAASALSLFAQGAPPATYAEVGACVRGVATQFSAEAFDKVVDRAVERCGGMIPFHRPPVEHASGVLPRPPPVEPDHTQVIRREITFRLKQVMEASSPQGHAPR